MMKSIAIITARGGSKRILNKNIKDFLGKPILAYSIEAAINSGIFSEVMVSTDSEEIARIAKEYGAKVPFMRSEKTSSDYATTGDVLEEVLQCYKERGETFDRMCCIYPTAPFVTAEKLKTAMNIFEQEKADSLLPVVRFSFPPQRAFVIRDGALDFLYPEYANTRSQDLEPQYHDCGQFYLWDVEKFYQYKSVVTPRTIPLIVSEEEVQDIDTLSDWHLAEQKYKTFILHE